MKNYPRTSDEQLMQQVQQGSEEAFNALYERYSQRLLFFMYKMLQQDEAKAQDLLQDVFLKVVEAPEKFDAQRSFKTWIFTVAANCCKNYFRAQKTAQAAQQQWPNISREEAPTLSEPNAFQQQLQQALNQLPLAYREVFLLKHKEGLQLKEIAVVLDCPVGTVKSRLHSATKQLAQILAPYKTHFLTK